jgi:hypothetical protein
LIPGHPDSGSLVQRDIVLRWIAQLSALIARILRRDSTLSLELARQYLEDAEAQVLGALSGLVPRLDAESAARLLEDPNRIYGYAQTLALRSALAGAAGAQAEADALAARAAAMGRAALARLSSPPEQWVEWVESATADTAGAITAEADADPGPTRSEP